MSSLCMGVIILAQEEKEQTMEEACKREIIALHAFFEGWFTSVLPNEKSKLARFGDVLAADFHIIGPSGNMATREAVIAAVASAHGNHKPGAFKIWVADIRVRHLADDLFLATYQEWQTTGDKTRARLSSAVFRQQEDTPNGLVWLHVHETWLP